FVLCIVWLQLQLFGIRLSLFAVFQWICNHRKYPKTIGLQSYILWLPFETIDCHTFRNYQKRLVWVRNSFGSFLPFSHKLPPIYPWPKHLFYWLIIEFQKWKFQWYFQ